MPKVRAEISQGNPYWLSKHRFYEVYHFALQYTEWKDRYLSLEDSSQAIRYDRERVQTSPSADGLENVAIERSELQQKIKMVEETAREADPDLYRWILKAVTTEEASFDYLKSCMNIPCERDMFYDRRRKFYWLLSKKI